MLVVVASRQDSAARDLVARWAPYGAVLLNAADLSVAGWRHQVGGAGEEVAVLGGRPVTAGSITGLLTRVPHISEWEIAHIHPDDRRYVAAEMTAFLASWLSRLACPVLNRPTPGCLAGPAWGPEHWVHAAARAGLPVRPALRRVRLLDGAPPVPAPSPAAPGQTAVRTVTVVGNRCFGTDEPALAGHAQRLAREAGVELLSVQFAGRGHDAVFAGAALWADVTLPDIADAIAAYLCGRSRC